MAQSEQLSVKETLALLRNRTEQAKADAARTRQAGMDAIAQRRAAREASAPVLPERNKKPQRIPGLAERLAGVDELLQRNRDLTAAQERVFSEIDGMPLDAMAGEVFADVADQMAEVDQQELVDDERLDASMTAEDDLQAEEERLEDSGQPPPIRSIK